MDAPSINLFTTARLFRSKLNPPVPTPGAFHRERLIHKLNEGWGRKLTLMTAPPGYGKTSLLQQWTVHQERPVGWLRLDASDDDLRRFLFYFVHAVPLILDDVQVQLAEWVSKADPGMLVIELESFAAQWIACLERCEQEIMIVVDGLETIRDPNIVRFLTLFLRFCPPHVHVVLSGRQAIGIELPRAEDGGCEIITAEHLALTRKELFHYVVQQSSVRLSDINLDDLMERSQGWLIGANAYLPLLRLKGQLIKSDWHDHAERETTAYFRDMISDFDPAALQVLMRLSVAKLFDSAIAGLLLEGMEQGPKLRELLRNIPFVFQQNNKPGQYAFHPMFCSFLQRELQEAAPADYAALHRKYASYAENQGQYIRAAEHAFKAGDRERAADVLERNAPELLRANLLPLLERFTLSELKHKPGLAYMYGYSLFQERKIQSAEQIANLLDEIIQSNNDVTMASTGERLKGYLSSLRSMIHYSRRETDLGLHYLKQTESEFSGPGKLHRNSIFLPPYTASVLRGRLGNYGVLKSALAMYEYVASRWGRQDRGYAVILVCLGECYYEEGRLEQAEEHLRRGLRLSLDLDQPGLFVPAFLALAQLNWRKGETEAAWAVLNEAREQLIQRDLDSELMPLVHACEAKLRIKTQDTKYVRQWLQTTDLKSDSPIVSNRIYEAFTLLRAYLFLGKMTEALTFGGKLLQAAVSTNHPRDLIEANLLLAQIYWKQGKHSQAFDKLDRALTEAQEQGYVQIVVDEGAVLSVLVKQYRKHNRLPNHTELAKFTSCLLKAIPKDEADEASSPITATLTAQENRVLQFIVRGASNRMIAETLAISTETAKKHCKHIYRKLGVMNRLQAIQLYTQLQHKSRPDELS